MKRREFLNHAGLAVTSAASVTLLANARAVGSTSANEKVNLAFFGCGGRGCNLLKGFLERNDLNIVACADPNEGRMQRAIGLATEKGHKPVAAQDFRTLLDRKDIDAVVSATPDHWHALITILSCQAGKDVYIEKPVSHSIWEGEKMIEAARKYKRIVQHGTQNRSGAYNMAARKYIEEGRLGKIHFARVYDQKGWNNFQMKPVTNVPDGFDWNLWSGPAPEKKYSPTYHTNWHHFWDYSSGDIINDTVHQIDLCRYLIGKEFPKSAYSVGGRFNQAGAAETPDTQITTFEFDDLVMTIEMTLYTPYILKIDPVVRESDMFPYWQQCSTRIEIYGDKGLMIAGRHGGGWEVYVRPKSRQPVVKDSCYGRMPDPEHKENFIHCIKTREKPNADIEVGHRSTLLAHYGTISYRLGGQKLTIDPQNGKILNCPEAEPLIKRTYRAPFVVPEEV